MFYDQLAPLGGTLGPLKSDLGLFLPFRATYFMSQKHTSSFLQKGPFPPVDLAENLCVDSNHLPDLNPRVGKWAIPGPKNRSGGGWLGAFLSPVCSTSYFAETHANSCVSTLIPNHAFYVFHAQSNIWLLLSSFFSLSFLFSVQIFAQGHFLQSIVSCNFLSHEITHLFVCSVFSCTLHTFSEGLSL